jgi:hypothetical protein
MFWMIVYLMALPIWNFVLPLYAFWHFDDFSWGQTRKVEGETKETQHGRASGIFDGSQIAMKKWAEWERIRKAAIRYSQSHQTLLPAAQDLVISEDSIFTSPLSVETKILSGAEMDSTQKSLDEYASDSILTHYRDMPTFIPDNQPTVVSSARQGRKMTATNRALDV